MSDVKEQLTAEEMEELQKFVAGAPLQDEKHNVHNFLNKVVITQDTTKLGYLNEDEIGLPRHPIRTYKEIALFCDEVADMSFAAEYYRKKSEIITSTSLSRNAKLLDLAVINRREIADVTKLPPTPKKSWFTKKDKKGDEQK